MKKAYFNKKYGLRQAVVKRRKTKTRRIIKGDFENVTAYHANGDWHFIADTKDGDSIELKPAFQIGEVVAVAQSYSECAGIDDFYNCVGQKKALVGPMRYTPVPTSCLTVSASPTSNVNACRTSATRIVCVRALLSTIVELTSATRCMAFAAHSAAQRKPSLPLSTASVAKAHGTATLGYSLTILNS